MNSELNYWVTRWSANLRNGKSFNHMDVLYAIDAMTEILDRIYDEYEYRHDRGNRYVYENWPDENYCGGY